MYRRRLKDSETNLPHYHSVHYKPHMNSLVLIPGLHGGKRWLTALAI
jgi:hypothetical protein